MVDLARRRLFSRRDQSAAKVTLPWLKSPEQFTDQCTRCNECISQCETNVIVTGEGGFPTVDFSVDECTFCYQCANACPESLFTSQHDAPWQIKAVISDDCLAKRNVECRACSDMCETMAIRFQLAVGQVAQPILSLDDCSGCGACVAPCPTKAIAVTHL